MKPRVFIGSSVEGLSIAFAIQENLEHFAEPTVWDQGIFELSAGAIENLSHTLTNFDFGLFVFSPDDTTLLRDNQYSSVRDNVVFELGLFIGSLGRERTFFVLPRGINDLRIPTDLAGITPATYDPNRQDGNLTAALGPACNKIRRIVLKLGPLNLRATSIQIHNANIATAPADESEATDVRRDQVIKKLRTLLDESKKVFAESKEKDSFEYGEQRLKRWKSRVVRFLDSNVSFDEASSFDSISTALGGATPMEHFISSFAGHRNFLEALIAEIEADSEFPVKPESKPSGNEVPEVKTFTYSR